jgi:hypothetical protein
MKTRIPLLALAAACALCTATHALYSLSYTGDWPKSWPHQLEPLRKQARTYVGPMVEQRLYAIRFSSREEFEAAWPQLLKVKTKGAPVFLLKGPSSFLGDDVKAGVIVLAPPVRRTGQPASPEGPIAGVEDPHVRWMNTTSIELVVDGEIIDPGRIRIPKDMPLIDERTGPAKGR